MIKTNKRWHTYTFKKIKEFQMILALYQNKPNFSIVKKIRDDFKN